MARRTGRQGTRAGPEHRPVPDDTPPAPFPCRSGKLREKIFRGLAPYRKVVHNQCVVSNTPAVSKARQGNGREARKPPDRRSASLGHRHHNNYQIDNFVWLLYGAELGYGKRAAGVVRFGGRASSKGTNSPRDSNGREFGTLFGRRFRMSLRRLAFYARPGFSSASAAASAAAPGPGRALSKIAKSRSGSGGMPSFSPGILRPGPTALAGGGVTASPASAAARTPVRLGLV